MPKKSPQPIAAKRTETVLEDYKGEYTTAQARVEANRCLFCEDAPCIQACPTSIDIPQFIRKIATDNVEGSARTIFESNILGMSCARVCPVEVLCVGDCVYNKMGVPPIQIGKLQRFATDVAYDSGRRFFEAGASTGKTVALIGAGPASLAAAHELRVLGHACTIYEKRAVRGGLNTTGVAPYKMKADRSEEEAEWVLKIGGITVEHGVALGEDLSLEDLEAKHDAVFLGMGLGPDRYLDVPGQTLKGIFGAVDWIEQMKLKKLDLAAIQNAVVIGGGNTALDAVRELVQLGIPSVTMVYRGDEQKMSGYSHEWSAAKQEGARAVWNAQPVSFEGEEEVTAVWCQRRNGGKPLDEDVRVEADLVLLAIGQSKLGALLESVDGIEIDWGKIVTDEHGCTGRAGVFAGGDCRNGGKEVVNAAAEGKAAARAIDAYLKGNSHG